MENLKNTLILSFEVGNDCNLKNMHPKCPINIREYRKRDIPISVEKIVESIKYAKEMKFSGYIAFHHYNEPLKYIDKILKIIEMNGDDKYLLWTNGILFDRHIKNNQFLRKFNVVYISCYYDNYREFFKKLQFEYGNIKILDVQLDDRIHTYDRIFKNQIGCKRPIIELPIDYFGNIHLCCYDWNNEYEIGNINDSNLKEIVQSNIYQKILLNVKKRLLDITDCPNVCLNCDSALFTSKFQA